MVHPVLRRREREDGDEIGGSDWAVLISCIQFYSMQELCTVYIQQTPTCNTKKLMKCDHTIWLDMWHYTQVCDGGIANILLW
jgi:hypothetical protein